MIPLATGLILMGLGFLYIAFLGWVGNAGPAEAAPPRNANADVGANVAARRHELAPSHAAAYVAVWARFRRPLVVTGVLACAIGGVLLLIGLLA